WYWWRFNGYGYCWGMAAGMGGAMFVPKLAELLVGHSVHPLYTFPVILGLSLVGCLLGTLLSKPEDEAILKEFYRTVRPWGVWGPIRRLVQQEQPAFQPNRDCKRDWVNVFVGIIWQLCLTSLPIYLVLRSWSWVGTILAVLAVTSVFLKFNWYDKLEKAPV
ncbi:MAG: sodium:solute symporter, partial [Verrucomicrobia bacterium]|nr:sodium:solute symporter [Verrucomicrobiota bacterium]